MTPKIAQFLQENDLNSPCLVLDLDVVKARYRSLESHFPYAGIFYAMKANPARPILELMQHLGASIDAASLTEIKQCLAVGIAPEKIAFGNTLKKKRDIKEAYDLGVRTFVFDCQSELDKLAEVAPGANVFCRLLVNRHGAGASWPLSRKFGCSAAMAFDLMVQAKSRGLTPYGLSFHVGSQQQDPAHWGKALSDVSSLFETLREVGINLEMVNIGGGFPARYSEEVPPIEEFAAFISDHMNMYFKQNWPTLMMEPGRYLVAEAGVIQSEVVNVAIKDFGEEVRWVYLDVGKFGGLAETIDESIIYQIETDLDQNDQGPVIIAGPTCDSCDTIYERTFYQLPQGLKAGDLVRILSAGAYTTMYASQGFNGFEPPDEHYI